MQYIILARSEVDQESDQEKEKIKKIEKHAFNQETKIQEKR